jgi:uncharacterized protein (UPF0332 family)
MNVTDFLNHAEEMANDGRPAWCRSAVSRAYYAAHHAAVEFLFRVGVRTPTDGTAHGAAFNALVAINATDESVKEAGSDLMTLHGKRNRADYRWDNLSMERQDQAQDLVANAKEIVNALAACLDDDDRADNVWSHFQGWIPRHGAPLGLSLV